MAPIVTKTSNGALILAVTLLLFGTCSLIFAAICTIWGLYSDWFITALIRQGGLCVGMGWIFAAVALWKELD